MEDPRCDSCGRAIGRRAVVRFVWARTEIVHSMSVVKRTLCSACLPRRLWQRARSCQICARRFQPLRPRSEAQRVRVDHCSNACQRAARTRERSAAARASRARKRCESCGSALSTRARAHARFCSAYCRVKANRSKARSRGRAKARGARS